MRPTQLATCTARALGLIAVSLCLLLACAKTPPPPRATVSARCPDLTKADELAAFDLAREYVLSPSAADKLRAAVFAAVDLTALADKLDAELGIACAGIAHDLGNNGDFRSANEACPAAVAAVQEARAKLGAARPIRLVMREPSCMTDTTLVTKCASLCDSAVPSTKVRVECEVSAGRCDGTCDGSCEPKTAAKCEGICAGTCDGTLSGTCGGKCVGTCDGKKVAAGGGPCLGVCVGTCEAGAIEGECAGFCAGSCKLAKPGICGGTCVGTCSVELAEPRCTKGLRSSELSDECKARCDLATIHRTECTAPQVGLVVGLGGKKDDPGDTMKAAIDRSLPNLLKILHEVGGTGRIDAARESVEGVRAAFTDMARTGGPDTMAAAEKQLVTCFDEMMKKGAADADAAKQDIQQAVLVREEIVKSPAIPP